jgi:hypothetical protein
MSFPDFNRGRGFPGRGGRGRGRGRGRGGGQPAFTRDQLAAMMAQLDMNQQGPQQQQQQQQQQPAQQSNSYTCFDCNRQFNSNNGLNQHRASLHGAPITRKDGTIATPRSVEADRQRSAAMNAQASGSNVQLQTGSYQPAPPLWVSRAALANIRQDSSLRSRVSLLNGRDVYVIPRNMFTIGAGTGNRLNVVTVASWSGTSLNGDAPIVPYPVSEFIGLDIVIHGDFGIHGDFALVYMTIANGATGVSGSNTSVNNAVSAKATNLLNFRWVGNASRHTVITGSSGNQGFFVPADGPGSVIEGAGFVNVVSGDATLRANAVLVYVTMNAVFAVSGDRQ